MAVSFGAKAQVLLDVSKITCGQFVAYKITNPKYLSVWISGYYHGLRKKLVVDTQRLVENADNLGKLLSEKSRYPDLGGREDGSRSARVAEFWNASFVTQTRPI